MAAAPSLPEEIFRPEYVKFLLSPSTPLDFHVNVGDPKSEEMERIGAVRWMLIARSKVLRVMLLESQLKTGKEFDITDLDPETFKHFLTFIYGHDNTSSLLFEDAVKLLGAAEKYDVPDLKNQLATVITPQVNADNVCTVLQHGPVCETVPALWDKATDTVQSYTDVVFGHEQFLTLRPEAVVHILQQDTLNVQEVDVWRAALKWAQHQMYATGGPPAPQDLRKTMVPLLRHTRLCTLAPAELCEFVIPTEIITPEEISNICLSLKDQEHASNLTEVCKETEKRQNVACSTKILTINDSYNGTAYSSKHIIETKHSRVNMLSFVFKAKSKPKTMVIENAMYECKATIKISRRQVFFSLVDEPIKEIQFNKKIPYGQPAQLPLYIELDAHAKYVIEVLFDLSHPCIKQTSYTTNIHKTTDDFELSLSHNSKDMSFDKLTHFKKWHYNICN